MSGDSKEAKSDSSRSCLNFSSFSTFLLSGTLVIVLFLARRSISPILQDWDVELSWLTIATLHPTTIFTLALLPVFVVVKEFTPIAQSTKQAIDSVTSFLCLILCLIAGWAIFSPLTATIQGLDG